MRVECTTELTQDQFFRWQNFLAEASHTHPEQDPRFAHVLRADGQDVLFAMGWVGQELRAVGLFSLHRHPVLKGLYKEAMAYSGPVCDDAGDLVTFLDRLVEHDAFGHVGAVRVTPYWLADEAVNLSRTLEDNGWSVFEAEKIRHTGVVDISGTASDIVGRFSQTGRRKVRKAERQELTVESDEAVALDFLSRLNRHRAERGLRAIAQKRFTAALEHVYRTDDLGTVLVVRHQGRFVAGLVIHRGRDTAHFMNSAHDDAILAELDNLRIAPFLLLEGMKWANARGSRLFDLEGYKEPLEPTDELYGIYKYKTEFSPRHVFRVAGHQKIGRPLVYLTGNAREILKPRVKSMLKSLKSIGMQNWP